MSDRFPQANTWFNSATYKLVLFDKLITVETWLFWVDALGRIDVAKYTGEPNPRSNRFAFDVASIPSSGFRAKGKPERALTECLGSHNQILPNPMLDEWLQWMSGSMVWDSPIVVNQWPDANTVLFADSTY